MGNILKLNRDESLELIQQLSDDISNDYNISCHMNNHMDTLSAATYSNDKNTAYETEIGISEIYNARNKFLPFISPKIQDEDFARIILNMYHEEMHIIQKNQIFQKERLSDNEKAQLLSEIACMGDTDYYLSNYKYSANEIQAEQYGIMKCYEYLYNKFQWTNPKQLEFIVLNVVNDKMMNYTYFVSRKEPFTSLSGVNEAFNKAYVQSFKELRTFFIWMHAENDIVKQYMQKHDEARDLWNYVIDLSVQDPLGQDACIAATVAKINKSVIVNRPGLSDDDFSYSVIKQKCSQRIRDAEELVRDIILSDIHEDEYQT